MRGIEFKSETKYLDPRVNEPSNPCEKSYMMTITSTDGNVLDPNHLQFIVDQTTTLKIKFESTLYPDLKPKMVVKPENSSFEASKTAGIYNFTFKPTSKQSNQDLKAVITLPVPKDGVCVKGLTREPLTLTATFGKTLPYVSIVDLDERTPYSSAKSQVFHVDLEDPNLRDSDSPLSADQALLFDYRSGYNNHETLKRPETTFVSAQGAVTCEPNAVKVGAKTYRYTCTIDFSNIKPNYRTPIAWGHSDFTVYGVSINGDKSIGDVANMAIQFPVPEVPLKPTMTEKPKTDPKKDKKLKKQASSKDSKKTSAAGDKT
jgi:hypothetical protein